MTQFRMLAENFFSKAQFSGHTITASTYMSGNEPWRVGTARRSARNAWATASTGTHTLRVTCDQVRAADMLALDRGHNLSTCDVQFTNSTAAGWTTHKSITLSTSFTPNTRLRDGTRTEEGAYVVRFGTSTGMPAAKNWRLSVTSTGAPKIVGAYLGLSFAATGLLPWDDDARTIQRAEVVSPELWTVSARVASRRTGTLSARLSELQAEQARYHVGSRFWKGEVAWIVPDENSAEKAVLANAPSGSNGMAYSERNRALSMPWVEYQPKPIR